MSFEIVQVPARAIACIRLKVPMSDMPLVFGPAIMELVSVLGQQQMQPDGAAFAHHFHCDGESFDFELGFFLPENSGPVQASGRVYPSERPQLIVARHVHRGGYENLHSAWSAFETALGSSDLTQLVQQHVPSAVAAPGVWTEAADMWEWYRVGPQSTERDSEYETDLMRPLQC